MVPEGTVSQNSEEETTEPVDEPTGKIKEEIAEETAEEISEDELTKKYEEEKQSEEPAEEFTDEKRKEPAAEEQSETPEEGTIPEQTEEDLMLPGDGSVFFNVTWDDDKPGIGSIAHFKATLIGYEGLNYSMRWQSSQDGETWTDIEGADDVYMDVEITEDNYMLYWRISVSINIEKEIE